MDKNIISDKVIVSNKTNSYCFKLVKDAMEVTLLYGISLMFIYSLLRPFLYWRHACHPCHTCYPGSSSPHLHWHAETNDGICQPTVTTDWRINACVVVLNYKNSDNISVMIYFAFFIHILFVVVFMKVKI